MRYLICHTGIEGTLTEGKHYEIVDESERDYMVIDDVNEAHHFTKHSDVYGFSYSDWFDLSVE